VQVTHSNYAVINGVRCMNKLIKALLIVGMIFSTISVVTRAQAGDTEWDPLPECQSLADINCVPAFENGPRFKFRRYDGNPLPLCKSLADTNCIQAFEHGPRFKMRR
jgi:hypothetical protein